MDSSTQPLSLDDFLPLIGTRFGGGAGTPSFQLVDARALPTHDYPGRVRDAFVLMFHGDTPGPEQGLRRFDLPGLGETDIFLVPVEQVGDLIAYEAVFN